jgi:hypothetical protein
MNMEELSIKYQNLCDWITHHGGFVNHKLKIEQTEKFGRSIIATQQLEAGEELFKLPKELQLNPETTGLSKYNLGEHFEYRDQVVISLLYECQNPNTKWRPYVLLLPQLKDFESHPIVIFYQNKFPNFSQDILSRVSTLYQSFNNFYVKLQHYNSQVNKIFNVVPNFNECIWAFLTVITRMWANAGLVPYADMLQHSNDSKIYLDTIGVNFSIMTTKSVTPAGSVIFDNYFVQDDITLYVNFGFVEESPTTHLSVGFQFETKNTLIASIINSERNKFQNKKIYLSTEGINQDLMGFLRLHMLDANDLKIANFENDTFFNQFITLGNELRSLQKLKNRLNFLIDSKELEFIENNIDNYTLYSPEWSVCKLILNSNQLKITVNKYIDDYWASFLN